VGGSSEKLKNDFFAGDCQLQNEKAKTLRTANPPAAVVELSESCSGRNKTMSRSNRGDAKIIVKCCICG
jgi:hypothetical protein